MPLRLGELLVKENLITPHHLICAQRLARRICKECKTPIEVPAAHGLIDAGYTPEEAKDVTVHEGRGCSNCNNTGYKDRVGLYEVLELSDAIRQLILEGASAIEIKKVAIEEGMISLRRSGLTKVRDGLTTLDEVVRETVK